MTLDPNIYGFDRVVFKHVEGVLSEWDPVLLDDSGINPPTGGIPFFPIVQVGEARSEFLCQGDLIRVPPSLLWSQIEQLWYAGSEVFMTLEGVRDVIWVSRGVMVEVLISGDPNGG